MFSSLPQDIQDNLTQLAQRFRQPLVRTVTLDALSLFDPLTARDRYGEVCMVVKRPTGHLLTMTKAFYPRGAYRLLTGGINFGESVLDALLRETYEETGLQVKVSRFLVALAYRVPAVRETPLFYTFAFLLEETGGMLGAIDESERVEAFREVLPAELPELATFLEHVRSETSGEIGGNWHDWGQFRAAIHRAVAEVLV
jgi:8-oxo-dGTP pyrophosphatase MutT (NUDIX family)